MKNKELIDHCNAFWGVRGYCKDCPYGDICGIFHAKYHDTPYRCDTLYDGKYYTDEEIEGSMRTEQEIRDRIEAVDQRFIKVMRSRYEDYVSDREFEELYSNAWEEEVALYWALGMSRKDAAVLVAGKFTGMYIELKK